MKESLAFEFSRQECFNIHPGKTKIMLYNYKGPKLENLHQWYLGDKIVNLWQSLEHLGITRYASVSSTKELISDWIKSARRAPIRKLCNLEDETTVHRLVRCLALSRLRAVELSKMSDHLSTRGLSLPSNDIELARLLLGATTMDRETAHLAAIAVQKLAHLRETL